MTLGVQYIFLARGLTRLATLFLAHGNDSIVILFAQAFRIMIIFYVDFPLGIVDATAVVTTFKSVAVAIVTATLVSTGLNAGKIQNNWYSGILYSAAVS